MYDHEVHIIILHVFMISDMTEDEMLDLAMKLSAQEANQRRQLEDNDMQKAIAESLNVADRVSMTTHFYQLPVILPIYRHGSQV